MTPFIYIYTWAVTFVTVFFVDLTKFKIYVIIHVVG